MNIARHFSSRLTNLSKCRSNLSIIRSTSTLESQNSPLNSNSEESLPKTEFKPFKSIESNPTNHSMEQEAKFYTLEPEVKKRLFHYGGFSFSFREQITTFNETCLMVRPVTLELIDYLNNADYSKPVNRYVLYGERGVGKTMILAHIVHYASVNNWLILHVPWVPLWTRRYKELSPSTRNVDRIDHPIDAVTWLQHFQSQNGELLKKLDLKSNSEYIWSKRETTQIGDSLLSIVEHGINRGKHASDCVAVIVKELKEQSKSGKFKLLVAIDGANAMFSDTQVKYADKTLIKAENLTLVRAFLKMLDNDWNNGAVVCTVCPSAPPNPELRKLSTPRALLGKKGFELLEPFVPLKVDNYSRKEALSCLDYYIDRNFIQKEEGRTDLGKEELIFLSGRNPEYLMQICASR